MAYKQPLFVNLSAWHQFPPPSLNTNNNGVCHHITLFERPRIQGFKASDLNIQNPVQENLIEIVVEYPYILAII